MQTLLLNPENWDLLIDYKGDIAVTDNPYRLAQDVACAIKTFKLDLWYHQDTGIRYYDVILGHNPNLTIVRDYLEKAALSVPDVVKARAIITDYSGRIITGQVIVTDATGLTQGVRF